jgi:hypothetical protein
MFTAVAPLQLPFSPRPFSQELLSSWLLRVAAANCVSLNELLVGFELRNRRLEFEGTIDYRLTESTVEALAVFCRTPVRTIHNMAIAYRAPKQSPRLLLRFTECHRHCGRACSIRARYAFCSSCLDEQTTIHVHWEWALSFLLFCPVHRSPMLEACPSCGWPDPLSFAGEGEHAQASCRFCNASLRCTHLGDLELNQASHGLAIETAYRAAILGIAPDASLLGKTSDLQFRQFVEDLLDLVETAFASVERGFLCCSHHPVLSRPNRLHVLRTLILNSAPASNPQESRTRAARGVKLWTTLLQTVPGVSEGHLDQISKRWPSAVRRRVTSTLLQRSRRPWPRDLNSPHALSLRFKYQLLSEFRIEPSRDPVHEGLSQV